MILFFSLSAMYSNVSDYTGFSNKLDNYNTGTSPQDIGYPSTYYNSRITPDQSYEPAYSNGNSAYDQRPNEGVNFDDGTSTEFNNGARVAWNSEDNHTGLKNHQHTLAVKDTGMSLQYVCLGVGFRLFPNDIKGAQALQFSHFSHKFTRILFNLRF